MFANGARRGTGPGPGDYHQNNSAHLSNPYQPPYAMQPAPHHAMPWVMPPMVQYPMGMYPLNALQPGASPYSDFAGYQVPNVPPTTAVLINHTPLNIPTIKEWLQFCSNHPFCSASFGPIQLSSLSEGLEQNGVFQIDQLEGPGIDVEKIIKWAGVMPGTALLLYHYAKENMALICAEQFSIDSTVTGAS